MMDRKTKVKLVEELTGKISRSLDIFFTFYQGLTVEEISDLRRRLRSLNTEYRVVKNNLFRRAWEAARGGEVLPELDGPLAVVFPSAADPIKLVKILTEFNREHNALQIKFGWLGKNFLKAEEIDKLSKIPSQKALLTSIVVTLKSPLISLLWVLQGKLIQLSVILREIEKQKKQVGGSK